MVLTGLVRYQVLGHAAAATMIAATGRSGVARTKARKQLRLGF